MNETAFESELQGEVSPHVKSGSKRSNVASRRVVIAPLRAEQDCVLAMASGG